LPKLGICPGPEVHGIVTFYHDFRQHPAGRSVLKLCLAEAGQSMNGAKIASDLLAALGISWGETISDGHLTVECVYCPALCACAPSAVAGLFNAGFKAGKDHPLRLGRLEDQPYLARRTRLTFACCGIVDPLSLTDYRAHSGYAGLERTLSLEPLAVVDEVKLPGLRERGGAGFPTDIKWNTVLHAEADQKYIVCNGDEGDSGTFADRMLMEGDPFTLIEGMTIAGLAVGATKGFIYIRSDYPHAYRTMTEAIRIATEAVCLGSPVLGSGRARYVLGICGVRLRGVHDAPHQRLSRVYPPMPFASACETESI
jgi:Respiratory-chain NADH dehydrogenase 51 Kd subunit/Thioredoxin-like [2Fe-2S] ferredoxin